MRKLLIVGALLVGTVAQAQTWQVTADADNAMTNVKRDAKLLVETWTAAPGQVFVSTASSTIFSSNSGAMTFCEDYRFLGIEGDTIFIEMSRHNNSHDDKDYTGAEIISDLRKSTPDSIRSANIIGCFDGEKSDEEKFTLRIPKGAPLKLLGNFKDLKYNLEVNSDLEIRPVRVQ